MMNRVIKLKVIEDEIMNEYELIDAIADPRPGSLEIFIDEAPDLSVIKLFGESFIKSLHMLTDNLGIPKKIIKITSFNLVQDLSVWPNIEIQHNTEFFTAADRFEVPYSKDIKKHFGVFVGTSRWHRLYLASMIDGRHRDKTLMSYWQHHINNKITANLHMDDVMLKDANETVRDNMTNFIKGLPMHLDPADISLNKNTGADITRGDWETPYEILPYYNNIFLDVVCETWHQGQCFLPNEKTGRPIISRTPFIVYASKGFLQNLKKIGFKTFDKWWSEEYDDYEGVKRIQRMLKVIDQISKSSVEKLNVIQNEMSPILEHNYKLLKSLSPKTMLDLISK